MKNSSNFLELSEKYRVIIFDLDDTIYPQFEYDSIVFREFFQQQGLDAKIGIYLAKFKRSLGYGCDNVFDIFFHNENININPQELVHFYREFLPKDTDKLHNSLKGVIRELSDTNDLYLVTNGRTRVQTNKLKMLDIEHYFKKIFILDPANNQYIKPSSKAINHSFFEKGECIYVGDSIIDRKFALNCGFDFYYYKFN